MNYTELVTAVQDYSENSESTFVTHIPDFVKAAEKRIYNYVQLPVMRTTSAGALTLGSQYFTLPSDFLAPYSFATVASNVTTFLIQKDVEYIREAYPTSTSTGTPVHYAIFDHDSFIVGPTPSSALTTELQYFKYPTTIVTASTTWLGDNFEMVLLYGTLCEAARYMKQTLGEDGGMLAVFEKRFQEDLIQLKRLGDGLDRRDAYRSGQARVEVP